LSREIILFIRPDGAILDANEAAVAAYGYSRRELLALTAGELSAPGENGLMARELAAAAEVIGYETTHRRKDGSLFAVQVEAQSLLHHKAPLWVTFVREISAAKRMEQAFVRSTQAVIQASPLPIVALSPHGRVTLWNQAAERVFGWRAEEVLGQPCPLASAEMQAEFLSIRQTALEGHSYTGLEVRRVKKNGEPIDVSICTAPLLDGAGRATGVMAVIEDVTERKLAEMEHARLVTAVEQATEAIFITDLDGTVQYVNPAFERITGYRREEALGQPPTMLKSDSQDSGPYQNLWDTIARGEVWKGRLVKQRKDGTPYQVESVISPVRDQAGQITNYVAVNRDISQEVALETQFLQSQKMEAIGRLAGGVAHDFNNLLTAIMGYSHLLLRKIGEQDALRGDIVEINKAAEKASSLTRQLLAFSRRQVLQPKVLNLNYVVTDISKMLERLIGEDIELKTQLQSELGSVNADPGQIEQVVLNLAINARDAMVHGGKLNIETANVDLDESYARSHVSVKPGPYVMVSISDNGYGMDGKTQSHIFEPFFTTKGVGKGTGLGLSTVYGIVKQSNGYIWVYSEPGLGTTFKIYLPRIDEVGQPYRKSTQSESIVLGGTETVLLVEDEQAVRDLIRDILMTHGYTVLEGANGVEGLELAKRYPSGIDLMVSDVVMPQMSGRELALHLKNVRPAMKVLYISGYTDKAILSNGGLTPHSAFLQKPFTIDVLMRKVRDVLDDNI